MTEKELVQLCKLGESTTVQYKLEFTTQKQIAEELVAFANTRGGIIIFGAEDKTGRMVGLTYEQVQYTSRELGNTANEHVRPIIYIETENYRCSWSPNYCWPDVLCQGTAVIPPSVLHQGCMVRR